MRSMRSRFGSLPRASRWAAVIVIAVAIVFAATGNAVAMKVKVTVRIVSQTGPPPGPTPANTEYFTTIQEAVNHSKKGNWVLIEPGVYDEEVVVKKPQGGIWIRGMDRNTVILDGQHKVPGVQGANGIEVHRANNVYIENLTARNFDRATPDGEGGNEIWWNGGEDSRHVGPHGWWGRYLTTYDDGLLGGYGIFTNNEVEGEWNNIYASGFNDSGMYLGACQECDAVIKDATMENNALGYSGSNSGGNLIIEKSTFRHNTTGIAPNSENPGDGPPPQDGECGRPNIRHPNPTPIVTTTEIARCTILRQNLITENNNLNAPDNPSSGAAPWGAGVELPGVYADQVQENTITDNPTDGVLAFEYPNPFPPQKGTIFFQNAGNEVVDNTFSGNGYNGGGFAADVAFEGGEFGMDSVNNCISGNSFTGATFPANIQETWGCENSTTPSPGGGFPFLEYLLELQAQSEGRTEEAQPVPPAQETMPDPCKGVPTNPLCP